MPALLTLAYVVIGVLVGMLSYRLMLPWSEQFMDRLFDRWVR